jgi:hypothetical protein
MHAAREIERPGRGADEVREPLVLGEAHFVPRPALPAPHEPQPRAHQPHRRLAEAIRVEDDLPARARQLGRSEQLHRLHLLVAEDLVGLVRQPAEHLDNARVPLAAQERQEVVAEAVAREPRVVVGSVVPGRLP